MKKIKKAEWKKLYPIKKAILSGTWLFFAYIVFWGVVEMIKQQADRDTIETIIGIFIAEAIAFWPIYKYVKMPYHCMPYLNKILTKAEMEELIEQETFHKVDEMKEFTYLSLLESEHWYKMAGRYVSKDLAIISEPDSRGGQSIDRLASSILFTLLDGTVNDVEWNRKTLSKNNKVMDKITWERGRIYPAALRHPQSRKNITEIFSRIFNTMKAEKQMESDKELILHILRTHEDYKWRYWNELPYYVEKGAEMEYRIEMNSEKRPPVIIKVRTPKNKRVKNNTPKNKTAKK